MASAFFAPAELDGHPRRKEGNSRLLLAPNLRRNLFNVLVAAGCTYEGRQADSADQDKIVEAASFYWQYAALAADV